MVIKELGRHKYVKAQQVTISENPYHQTSEILIDELPFGQGQGITSNQVITITIRQEQAQVRDEPPTYQSGNEDMATLPKVVQEKAPGVYTIVRRRDTSLTSGSLMEELEDLLYGVLQDWVEVYPGYRVTAQEYARRFQGVAIDHFKKVLPLQLFKTYVHTMGFVEGWGIKPGDRYKGKD